MSTQTARGLAAGQTDEERIERYLSLNPDFFERHQPLLARMRLPHMRTGSTVSLVERQVEVLREQKTDADRRLAEFVARRARQRHTRRTHPSLHAPPAARANRGRGARRARSQPARRLRRVSLRAAAHRAHCLAGHGRSSSRSCASSRPTTPTSARSKRCSPPASRVAARCATRSAISCSAPRAASIGSVALVPLGENGTLGLLALGSAERERFHPGMSTEFLKRMGELITDALVTAREADRLHGRSIALCIDGYLTHLGTERRLSPHTASNYARDLRALADFMERGNLADWSKVDSQHVRMFAARSHAGGPEPAQRAAPPVGGARLLQLPAARARRQPAIRRSTSAHRRPRSACPARSTSTSSTSCSTSRAEDALAVRDKAIMELFYSSGLRLAELVGLDICAARPRRSHGARARQGSQDTHRAGGPQGHGGAAHLAARARGARRRRTSPRCSSAGTARA